ncbi:MAG TPA: isochorismate synthase [Actinomycetota bacterium]|nr:isochorismate synthase [Actinomycetota bacterium]
MTPGSGPPPLVCTTEPLEAAPDLLAHLPETGGIAWIRHGVGFVGWGEAARIAAGTGPDRFGQAAGALARLFEKAEITNAVGGWGTGPLAFGSFTFDPDSLGSALTIPETLIAWAGGRAWVTRCSGPATGNPQPPAPTPASPGLDNRAFTHAVTDARTAIRAGGLDKVVLSLQTEVIGPHDFSVPGVVRRLAGAYPDCYAFALGSFVGASPELLVRREGTAICSVPLAGTARRGSTPAEDEALGAALLASRKDRWEHDLAVVTVVESLRPLCARLRIDPEPWLLRLANVQHLATQVTGQLAGAQTALEIAGAVHPSAAVCGTPTRKALAVIRQLEGAHRGRYAGPVGWVGADGDGEWAIALRCGELQGGRARLYAGAGIVAESDPDAELEEALLKLRPVLSALDLA